MVTASSRGSPHRETAGPPVASARQRRRRWPRRCIALVGCLLVVLALGTAILVAAVPSVADAQHLVHEHLADHGGQAIVMPPAKVSAALVATEDHAFYDWPGVDIAYGVGRLAYSGLHGRTPQGGATIAQQLAKNLYTGPGGGVFHEIEEVGLAFKLELTYSHAQLLDMYLNDAYFGDGAYGVSQAARRYFGEGPSYFGWAQAALLAGLVQAPSAYDPVRHPQAARQRRAEVLDQLVETGALSATQAHDLGASAILPRPR